MANSSERSARVIAVSSEENRVIADEMTIPKVFKYGGYESASSVSLTSESSSGEQKEPVDNQTQSISDSASIDSSYIDVENPNALGVAASSEINKDRGVEENTTVKVFGYNWYSRPSSVSLSSESSSGELRETIDNQAQNIYDSIKSLSAYIDVKNPNELFVEDSSDVNHMVANENLFVKVAKYLRNRVAPDVENAIYDNPGGMVQHRLKRTSVVWFWVTVVFFMTTVSFAIINRIYDAGKMHEHMKELDQVMLAQQRKIATLERQLHANKTAAHFTSYMSYEFIEQRFGVLDPDKLQEAVRCMEIEEWHGVACRDRTFTPMDDHPLNLFEEAEWMKNTSIDLLFNKTADGVFIARKTGLHSLYAKVQLFYNKAYYNSEIKSQAFEIIIDRDYGQSILTTTLRIPCRESVRYYKRHNLVDHSIGSCSINHIFDIVAGDKVMIKSLYPDAMIDVTSGVTYFGGHLLAGEMGY